MRTLTAIACTILLAAPAAASDFTWRDITPKLEGCWAGTGMGGEVSECWLVNETGRADGIFMMRGNAAMQFSQILTIDDFGEGIEMRLKHVNADMTGWEEKDDYLTFRLIDVEADRLIFKGLTLIFDGEDQRKTELQMTFGDGDPQTVPFDFTRTASLSSPEN